MHQTNRGANKNKNWTEKIQKYTTSSRRQDQQTQRQVIESNSVRGTKTQRIKNSEGSFKELWNTNKQTIENKLTPFSYWNIIFTNT